MLIKDIMSKKLIKCEIDDNVIFVSNLMKKYAVGFVTVMDGSKLYGVVTDRDLVCDLASSTEQIKRYANTKIISIDENSSPEDALNIMKEHKIKRLIVSKEDKVSGVISLSDIYNSGTPSEVILEALKQIYAINRNDGYFDVDVDDFIL